MSSAKERIKDVRADVIKASNDIHEHPELGNQEFHAADVLTELLEKYGFETERKIAGLETAFIAKYKSSKAGPKIAFLAEYDALPGLGHACGHNMVGAFACLCGIASKEAVDNYGGEIDVIGCPAEETSGGKTVLAEKGYFDEYDIALMAHPNSYYASSGTTYAMDAIQFEFFGKEAHAATNPQDGINALDAVLETFAGINAIRQHVLPSVRIHGIIKDGGVAPNVVPGYACARFYVRAQSKQYLRQVTEKVKNCAAGAAMATGATLKTSNFEYSYDNLVTNRTLSDAVVKNCVKTVGRTDFPPDESMGSSDIGNVSQKCPTVHGWFDITRDVKIGPHTNEFRECAISDYGYDELCKTAEGFVLTVEEYLQDDQLRAKIRKEFEEREK